MDGESPLSDDRIDYSPKTNGGSASFRGKNGYGWFVGPADYPQITVQLSQRGSEQPSSLEMCNFFGNVGKVTTDVQLTKDGDFVPYMENVDVSQGSLVFTDVNNEVGIDVYAVRISFKETKDISGPFAIRLEVFACVKGKLPYTVACFQPGMANMT